MNQIRQKQHANRMRADTFANVQESVAVSKQTARICLSGDCQHTVTVTDVWPRRIGILGGLGPFAHIEFERRLLEAATRHLGHSPRDQELPHWILASLPQTPDRSAAVLSGAPSPVPLLLEGLRLLRDADFAVIACNTAHIFIAQLRDQASLPIVDIVAETIKATIVGRRERLKVGLLGSTGTIESGLYQQTAKAIGFPIEFVTPLDLKVSKLSGEVIQKRYVTDLIFGRSDGPDDLKGGIKAGAHNHLNTHRKMRASLTRLLKWFGEAGVGTVILGCTELPLVLCSGSFGGMRLVDPLEIAASCAVEIAAGCRPLPTLMTQQDL